MKNAALFGTAFHGMLYRCDYGAVAESLVRRSGPGALVVPDADPLVAPGQLTDTDAFGAVAPNSFRIVMVAMPEIRTAFRREETLINARWSQG